MESAKTNFYLWQNKKWLNDPENKIPDEYSSWGSFVRLSDISLKNQIKILSDIGTKINMDERVSDDEMKIGIIYNKTMEKFQNWENTGGDCDSLKREIENMLSLLSGDYYNGLANYAAYSMVNGIDFPIVIDKENDLENSDNIKLAISPGSYILPGRDYYFNNNFKKQRENLRNHLEKIKNLVGEYDIELGDSFVDDVISCDETFAKISMDNAQQRLFDQYYTKTTMTDFYENINGLKFVKEKLNNYEKKQQKCDLSDSECLKIKK